MPSSLVYPESFYARPTLEVAPELIGAVLNRRLPDESIISAEICEVEAYTSDDPACHAFKGMTSRCQVMFGPAGRSYVYFIYGMYHCLNVVTEPDGVAGAILIRAVDAPGLNGPGKLCRAWQIDRSLNGVSLLDERSKIWISARSSDWSHKIETTPRIGISLARDKLWRFTKLQKNKLMQAVR